jgi:hypothetical protein
MDQPYLKVDLSLATPLQEVILVGIHTILVLISKWCYIHQSKICVNNLNGDYIEVQMHNCSSY